MLEADSPAILVARFLRSNHYEETFEAFIKEAGLSSDAGIVEKDDLTLEKILDEKRLFDLSTSFERTRIDQDDKAWSMPAPSKAAIVSSLPSATNILHVSIEHCAEDSNAEASQLLFATTADRRLSLLRADESSSLFKSTSHINDSPILSCVVVGNRRLISITGSMSGQVVLYDHVQGQVLAERRDHKKYVVKVATCQKGEETFVATAGWDGKVFIYALKTGVDQQPADLGEPIGTISLPTNPETVVFTEADLENHDPVLIVTCHDSTSLHYFAIPSSLQSSPSPSPPPPELRLLGRQNLAPHSNAWNAFSPSSVAICPTDPTLLAVATSAVPHMKIIIVRLLLPPFQRGASASAESEPATQVAQTRVKLTIQDREDRAILIHVSTFAPQTPYSTPQVCWRPDGSGVWVNGDDGILRGLEAKTGKVVTALKGGHEAGSKIRSIWAGWVIADRRREEWVVSGGFDRRLVVWKPDK